MKLKYKKILMKILQKLKKFQLKRKRNSHFMNKINHIAIIMDGNGRWGKKEVNQEIMDILKE